MKEKPVFFHLIDELKMGGAQTHLVTILREWRRRDQFTHVVVSLFNDGVCGNAIRELGIEVIVLNLADAVNKHEFWKAHQQIYKLIRSKHPVLLETHLTYSRLLGLLAARLAGVKRCYSFEHGDIYFHSWKWRVANFLAQFLPRTLIVCSQALSDWMQKTHGIFSKHLKVLHNCVDPKVFHVSANPSLTREILKVPAGAFVFCAVGTLGKGVNKRVDICLRALAKFQRPNAYLFICGDGEQRADLEKLAFDLQIDSQVRFLGLRNDVPDVLKMANAFVHAAPFEPFGIVCIEAMLSGLPVLVPQAGGIQEIVEEEVTGLKYPALDENAMATKMSFLMDHRERGIQIGQRGQDMVLKEMTVEKYVNRLCILYGV